MLTDGPGPSSPITKSGSMHGWQFEAFTDLLGYLSWHVAPDQRAQDEARIVGELGAWIGAQVLRPGRHRAGRARRPVTVRVILPREAGRWRSGPLSSRTRAASRSPSRTSPWSWTRAPARPASPDGRPTPRPRPVQPPRGRPGPQPPPRAAGAGQAHRADRRHRQGRRRAGPPVRRDPRSLRDVLAEGEGWDVIHISGHGAPGELAAGNRRGHAGPGHRRRTGRHAGAGPRAGQAGDRLRLLVGRAHRRRAAPPARPARRRPRQIRTA